MVIWCILTREVYDDFVKVKLERLILESEIEGPDIELYVTDSNILVVPGLKEGVREVWIIWSVVNDSILMVEEEVKTTGCTVRDVCGDSGFVDKDCVDWVLFWVLFEIDWDLKLNVDIDDIGIILSVIVLLGIANDKLEDSDTWLMEDIVRILEAAVDVWVPTVEL